MQYETFRDYDLFQLRLHEATKRASTFSVALIDIDHFHRFNQDWTATQQVERIYSLLTTLFPDLFYLGRDEFAVISSDHRGEELLVSLATAKQKFEAELQTTFCAGIAEYPKNSIDLIEIVRHLEESVYKAKKEGRNRIYLAAEPKMKLKSNYYTPTQLSRLAELSKTLGRSEASLLRESLDTLFRKYEN